jgi:hypothetical protein
VRKIIRARERRKADPAYVEHVRALDRANRRRKKEQTHEAYLASLSIEQKKVLLETLDDMTAIASGM